MQNATFPFKVRLPGEGVEKIDTPGAAASTDATANEGAPKTDDDTGFLAVMQAAESLTAPPANGAVDAGHIESSPTYTIAALSPLSESENPTEAEIITAMSGEAALETAAEAKPKKGVLPVAAGKGQVAPEPDGNTPIRLAPEIQGMKFVLSPVTVGTKDDKSQAASPKQDPSQLPNQKGMGQTASAAVLQAAAVWHSGTLFGRSEPASEAISVTPIPAGGTRMTAPVAGEQAVRQAVGKPATGAGAHPAGSLPAINLPVTPSQQASSSAQETTLSPMGMPEAPNRVSAETTNTPQQFAPAPIAPSRAENAEQELSKTGGKTESNPITGARPDPLSETSRMDVGYGNKTNMASGGTGFAHVNPSLGTPPPKVPLSENLAQPETQSKIDAPGDHLRPTPTAVSTGQATGDVKQPEALKTAWSGEPPLPQPTSSETRALESRPRRESVAAQADMGANATSNVARASTDLPASAMIAPSPGLAAGFVANLKQDVTKDDIAPMAELIGGGSQPAGAPHTPVDAAPLRADPALARHVGTQIADLARSHAGGPVELTLRPEELGKVRLVFHHENGHLTVQLTTERPETMDLMRRNIESLAQELRNIGYREVSFGFGSGGQGGQAGQQGFDNGEAPMPAGLDIDPDRVTTATERTAQPELEREPDTGIDIRL